ncbi:glycosyl hydrolase [Hymenobacter sp.]|jgi:hypothetical protein|uniref:glycosyl hydrolase n=1 Tax=Hymenobacter sp. TaxID=1898978 RepID=UPI002ED822F8
MTNFNLHRVSKLHPGAVLLLLLCWLSAGVGFAQSGAGLTAAWLGTVDEANLKVNDLPNNGRVIQLVSAIQVTPGATFRVVGSAGQSVSKQAPLTSDMAVELTAADGTRKLYDLELGSSGLPVEPAVNASSTVASITNKVLNISGNSEYHVTNTVNPLAGSLLDLRSDNVWLYFDNIRPSVFNKRYLAHVLVNGQRAQIDTTVRLVQYLQGCVLISQPATYQALTVFTGTSLGGSSQALNLYTPYKSAELGAFNNTIASFRLKKGYMATFAENETGSGTSKVYIAADQDVVINQLPTGLRNNISFVLVRPWRWVAKKGWTSGYSLSDTLRCAWNYNWNNNDNSTLDQEYVPIRQTRWWPDYGVSGSKRNVTHFLGFNEPNAPEQANMTVNQAVAEWPNLLRSGLRVGSPAVTDGGLGWLYSFMDKCDSANFRVDFVAVHYYRGCQSARQYYDFLKGIHDRTGKPIWITEWNNGANWTNTASCPKPTYQQQAERIQQFLTMLDTTSFVERYSLYEWVQDTRQMFLSGNPIVLNPAGVVYRDKVSPMAYNPNLRVPVPVPPVPFTQGNLALVRYGNLTAAQGGTLPVFVDEYTRTGTLVRSIALPTSNKGSNFGVAGSLVRGNGDGPVGVSPDHNQMALATFNIGFGNGNPNGSTAARVVAIVDAQGNVNTRTGFSDGSGSPLRTALATDTSAYIAYGANNLGLRYGKIPPQTASVRTRTSSSIFGVISPKKMAVYGNELYFTSSNPSGAKVQKLSGVPGSAATPVALPGIPLTTSTSQASGFAMFDINPNVPGFDLLYFVDEIPTPVLYKFSFDGSTWTARGTLAITGLTDNTLRDLTGSLVKGVPTLYGVSYTSLVKLVDKAASYTSPLSITQTAVINLPTSTGPYAFRGLASAPGTKDTIVYRLPQTIAFESPLAKRQADTDSEVGATASSGLPVSYTSSDTTVAKLVAGKLHLVGVGTTTITATQPGDATYYPAAPVQQTLTVAPLAVKVQYRDDDSRPLNNTSKPVLQLTNEGAGAVAYGELTARYWLTVENYTGLSAVIDYAALGAGQVHTRYVPLTQPRNGAYGYVEYTFEAALPDLAAGSTSGEIKSRLHNTEQGSLNEQDDYSFSSAARALALNEHLTLYRNGQLVWGTEPTTVAPVKAVEVLSQNRNHSTIGNTISTFISLANTGNEPLNYADVKVRYWFSPESPASLTNWVDWAKVGAANVTHQASTGTASVAGADAYLEFGFAPGAGQLYPLSSTGDIKFRVAKSDWSSFVEDNDYSYRPAGPVAANDHITVYYQGQLLYGVEPTNTAARGGKTALSTNSAKNGLAATLEAYPNPFAERTTIRFRSVRTSKAQLQVFNPLGQLVTTLYDGVAQEGHDYSLELNGQKLAAGIYTCRLLLDGKVQTQRVVVTK